MSIIPDYARQGIELMRQLEGQASLTAQYWSDGKRKEYYSKYIMEYLKWLEAYVYGSDGMQGKGLNELLEYVSTKIDEFEDAAESSILGDIIAPGYAFYNNSEGQILAPAGTSANNMASVSGNTAINDAPDEMSPENLTERRNTWTVDYNLNSPGNFSTENLREILKKRING
ncbi:MAG: hypothetical protein NC102_02655 [Clostridium sp.]|nr:hypothetical protein [Clostridium sp.]